MHLRKASFPVLRRHSPEADETRAIEQIARRYLPAPIAFSPKRQHGVWPGFDGAADGAREVNAEEREPRIGHRINEVLYEVSTLRNQLVVFAAERNNSYTGIGAAQLGDTVTLQSATVDQVSGAEFASGRAQNEFIGATFAIVQARIKPNLAAGGPNQLGIFSGDDSIIHNPRLRHPQSRDAGHMWLALADLFRSQPFEPFQPVGPAAALQLSERRNLTLIDGDDNLAAALVGDAVFFAEPIHRLAAGGAQASAVRTRLVIESRVNDAAIVSALVLSDIGFRFEDDHSKPAAPRQLQRRRQPDQAAAD